MLDDVQADVELVLPPGEVAVATVSKEQIELMEQFDLDKLRAVRPHSEFLHTSATSGIHSVKSGETTRAPVKFGTCITGQIQTRHKKAIPDWDQSEFSRCYIQFVHTHTTNGRGQHNGKWGDFDGMVEFLSTVTGRHLRIKTQSGVLTALKTQQGRFVSYPLPEGSYHAYVYGLHRTPPAKTGRNETVVGSTLHELVPASRSETAGNAITIDSSGILNLGEVRAVNEEIVPTHPRLPGISERDKDNRFHSRKSSDQQSTNEIAIARDSDISSVETEFANIDQDLFTVLDDYSIDHPEVQAVIDHLRQRLEVQLNVRLQQRSAEINSLAIRLEDARKKLKQRSDNATRIVERQLLKLIEQQGVDRETAKSLLKKDE